MSEYIDIDIINGMIFERGVLLKINHSGVKLEITKPRSLKQLKKYFALMEFTAFNSPEWAQLETKDDVHELIKSRLGTKVFTPDGKLSHTKPISVSFSKTKQSEFNEIYSRALDICSKIIGVAPEQIIKELVEFF